MRLKRANGRGQTMAHKLHFARTARRATDNGAVTGNGTFFSFELLGLKEVARCKREGVRSVAQGRALNQTTRTKIVASL